MFIKRDYSRPVQDDYKLQVQPHLDRDAYKVAEEVTVNILDEKLQPKTDVVGWKIANMYE